MVPQHNLGKGFTSLLGPWVTLGKSRILSEPVSSVSKSRDDFSRFLRSFLVLKFCDYCLWTLQFEVWKGRLRLQDQFYLHLTTMWDSRQPSTPIWGLWKVVHPQNQITEEE